MIMKFKYGLWYKDRLFVWHDKELYRYPYSNSGRYFGLRKISKKGKLYRLTRDWVTVSKVESLTQIVNVEPVSLIKDEKDLPF